MQHHIIVSDSASAIDIHRNIGTPGDDTSDDDFDLRIHEAVLAAREKPLPEMVVRPRLLHIVEEVENPKLSVAQILKWADFHFKQTGKWPNTESGSVENARGEKWSAISQALSAGKRGLPGGTTLAKLLYRRRGVEYIYSRPKLSVDQILAWADAYFARRREWPNLNSRWVPGAPQESWAAIRTALANGCRGLPGGSTLAKLLHEHRGLAYREDPGDLCIADILEWADSHYERIGAWPKLSSGPVVDAPEETWAAINEDLRHGYRGLAGGITLRGLLCEHRGYVHKIRYSELSEEQILAWADNHHSMFGTWPDTRSGRIVDAPTISWLILDNSLRDGRRGLPGNSSLAILLDTHRGVFNPRGKRPLTIELILEWADAYYAANGTWPTVNSGQIEGQPHDTWTSVNKAMHRGGRGMPGGYTLAKLLHDYRGLSHLFIGRDLTHEQILEWADVHYASTGKWPTFKSGPVIGVAAETWSALQNSLRKGGRGLTGGSSIALLLADRRGVPYRNRGDR